MPGQVGQAGLSLVLLAEPVQLRLVSRDLLAEVVEGYGGVRHGQFELRGRATLIMWPYQAGASRL